MDFHKSGQTRARYVLCMDCHESIPSTQAGFYLQNMKYEVLTITRNSSRDSRLTENDRNTCAGRMSDSSSSWWLCLHVEQSWSRICVRVNRLALKSPSELITSTGTDFTRLHHSSWQLSLIEIPKCNALQAAAATENDPRDPWWISSESRQGWPVLFRLSEPLVTDHKWNFMRIIQ